MPKRILIVDDSQAARNVIKRSLEICGYDDAKMIEAGHGREALDILKKDEVDIVFTDLNMPEMGGEELLKRIKSSPKLNELPVIIISSMTNPSKENKLLQEHASKILSKPISLPELQEFLEQTFNMDMEL